MTVAKFDISLNQVGASKLEINGIDFMHDYMITAAQVTAFANQPTVLALTIAAPIGDIRGEGIVNIHHPSVDMVQFLERISPKQLEEAALDRMGWGDNRAIVEVVLEIIKEKVGEAQSQASAETLGGSDGE